MTMTGDGKDMTVDITFNPTEIESRVDNVNPNAPSNLKTETLTLTLALDANMRHR